MTLLPAVVTKSLLIKSSGYASAYQLYQKPLTSKKVPGNEMLVTLVILVSGKWLLVSRFVSFGFYYISCLVTKTDFENQICNKIIYLIPYQPAPLYEGVRSW